MHISVPLPHTQKGPEARSLQPLYRATHSLLSPQPPPAACAPRCAPRCLGLFLGEALTSAALLKPVPQLRRSRAWGLSSPRASHREVEARAERQRALRLAPLRVTQRPPRAMRQASRRRSNGGLTASPRWVSITRRRTAAAARLGWRRPVVARKHAPAFLFSGDCRQRQPQRLRQSGPVARRRRSCRGIRRAETHQCSLRLHTRSRPESRQDGGVPALVAHAVPMELSPTGSRAPPFGFDGALRGEGRGAALQSWL